MTDINVVVLMGRLTRDAELKYTKSGIAVARFSIAVKRSRKQDDQWVEESSFFDVDFYGKSAESVHKYLVKGQQIGVEGELRQDRWEQEGQPRSKVIVVASNVRLLGNAPGGQSGSTYSKPQSSPSFDGANETRNGTVSTQRPQVDTFDDDIPF
jgi:single-strand DNA-binding protein